jgi:hypothetical protein
MNVPQKPRPFREGFVEEKDRPAPAPKPAQAPVPPPVIAEAEPAAALEAEPAADEWPITVKLLHRPVRNGKNEMVKELTFREPTAGDINRFGNPVRIDQNGDVLIEERKMSMVISTLSGILPPFIELMDPRDWNSCAYRLRGFFLPDPAAW